MQWATLVGLQPMQILIQTLLRLVTSLRTTLEEIGHTQPATPIKVDNLGAAGIIHDTVKQRQSKAIDMHFYWIKDRVKQGKFTVYWKRGQDNLADYFTKHHSPAHHRLM